jgi:hypothetical protein
VRPLTPNQTIKTREEGNQWYPLPQDYPDLTDEGQRQARVYSCSRIGTPSDLVESWSLFRQLYLFTTPGASFYTTGLSPSPPAHYEWIHDSARYKLLIIAAPRLSAKSVVIGKELVLLKALAQPYRRTTITLSTDNMVAERFADFMTQFEHNELLVNDFGKMRPPRASAKIWNHSHLMLLNGSVIRGVSVQSRKRGIRSHDIILDDPEYDPEKEGQSTSLLTGLDTLLFKQLIPMGGPDVSVTWIGTLIARKSAIYRACHGEDDRFNQWMRRVYSMISRDADGNTRYLWPQLWNAKALARRKRILGSRIFMAEMMNKPVSDDALVLTLHENFNYYTQEGQAIYRRVADGKSDEGLLVELNRPSWLDSLFILTTCDPAKTEKISSDFSAICTVGIDPENTWWLLDLWLGHKVGGSLLDELFRRGSFWQSRLVGIEDLGLVDSLSQRFQDKVDDAAASGWVPRVWQISYKGKIEKATRIEGVLGHRLARHTILLPRHRMQEPAFVHLANNIRNFTPDLSLIDRDDDLDSLSMVGYCPHGRSRGKHDGRDYDSIEAQIAAGRTTEKYTGLPLLLFINPQTVDPKLIQMVRGRRHHLALVEQALRKHSGPQATRQRLGCAKSLSRGIIRPEGNRHASS